MRQKIAKIISMVGLTCATTFAFGWNVYAQAENGNVARLQGTIPAYCPGGIYSDADNLRGALQVVEDYLNAFQANDAFFRVAAFSNNIIYKYCHDGKHMAETLERILDLYTNAKYMSRTYCPSLLEPREETKTLTKSLEKRRNKGNFSPQENIEYLVNKCKVNTLESSRSIANRKDYLGEELSLILQDIRAYLGSLKLDESRLQYDTSREFVANYHSKDNLKSRIKDALKLREVARKGLGMRY